MNAESIERIISQISRSNLAANWLLSKRALPMTIESGQVLKYKPSMVIHCPIGAEKMMFSIYLNGVSIQQHHPYL